VGADGKLYTSAGIPKEPQEKHPKEAKHPGDEEATERGRRGMSAAAPAGEAIKPAAAGPAGKAGRTAEPGEAFPGAGPAGPPESLDRASTIDEMLELMAKQVNQILKWTQADGFIEAYRNASANARGLFQTAALNLYKRAGQLRQG